MAAAIFPMYRMDFLCKSRKVAEKDPDAGDHIKDRGGSPHPEDLKGRGKASLGLFQIIDDHIHVGDQKDLHQTCHQGAVQDIDQDLSVKPSAEITFQFYNPPPRLW